MDAARFNSTLTQLRTILAGEGVRASLRFLNSLTTHRFTALYRFDNELLTSLFFFDRDNPDLTSSPQIPVMASYCVFVRDSSQYFSTTDAPNDRRADGHPKQPVIQSYCGVPILDDQGRMFGTICHFDFRPMPIDDMNVALMEELGPLLREAQVTTRKPSTA